MSNPEGFDAASEAEALRAQTRTLHKRQYKKRWSQLDRYTSELLALQAEGSSVAELQRWLEAQKHIRVAHSTVTRWLARHRG